MEGKTNKAWDVDKYSAADLVFMARLAEQAERYEEMKTFMKAVAKKKSADKMCLETEERNLMSVAYKNVVGARRASWRVLHSLLKNGTTPLEKQVLKNYIDEVEKELSTICYDILDLLNDCLIKQSTGDVEQQVFYCKMKGDYFRYMAEYHQGEEADSIKQDAKHSYKEALEHAKGLPRTNPIRLGLALNFSVFYYEILRDKREACILAKQAFDDAVGELEELNEDAYKDATLIMQLLRDNLTLWQSEDDQDEDMGARMEQDGTVMEDFDD